MSGNSPKLYLLIVMYYMAISSFLYIICIHLYHVYKENGIKIKRLFNVTEFKKISKVVTLTCILYFLRNVSI